MKRSIVEAGQGGPGSAVARQEASLDSHAPLLLPRHVERKLEERASALKRPGLSSRLARAEADRVTALVKENKKLAAELRQLHQWREAVGGSFKLAWQHERAAHQRDINGVTLDLAKPSCEAAMPMHPRSRLTRGNTASSVFSAKRAIGWRCTAK